MKKITLFLTEKEWTELSENGKLSGGYIAEVILEMVRQRLLKRGDKLEPMTLVQL